jgi:hypothetical protein
MKYYYAASKGINNELMVFDSKEKRDKWVSYQDDFSICFELRKEEDLNKRRAISEREAIRLAGEELANEENYVVDVINGGVAICWEDNNKGDFLINRDNIIEEKFKEFYELINND